MKVDFATFLDWDEKGGAISVPPQIIKLLQPKPNQVVLVTLEIQE